MTMGPSFWTREDEAIAKAGASGDLRCDTCGTPVTIFDPFALGSKMAWLDAEKWVEDGVPKARCRGC